MRTGVSKDKAKDKNVTYARLKRNGMRFEISLYRDKIPTKAEVTAPKFAYQWTDMLVSPLVYSNAAKGEPAEKQDIAKAFPEMSVEDVWKMIFEKGEVVQTQEDRVDNMAEDKHNVAKLAATVAAHSHVLPVSALKAYYETKADKELSKLRLERYSTADIERELKNARFKPLATSVTSQDTVIDAIAAIRAVDTVPIVRDQHICIIRLVKDSGVTVADVTRAFSETVRPMHGQILRTTQDDVVAVIDIADAVKTLQQNETLRQCQVQVSEEFYIPRDPNFADDLTAVTSGAVTKAKGGAAPPAKAGGKAKAPPPQAPAASSGLEAQLAGLKTGEESDDESKGGKKAKGKKAKQQQPAPGVQKKGPKKIEDSDDDELPKAILKKAGSDSEDEEEPVATMKPKKKK
jgi:ribosome maturation protein Sdo1